MLKKIALVLSSVAVAGCAVNPMTPDEFRKLPMMLKKESFSVDRPLAAVASSFRKMGPECFDNNAYRTNVTFGSSRPVMTSRSTVLVKADSAEFHLQIDGKGDLARRPEGGNYWFVADAKSEGAGRTRVDVYRAAIYTDLVMQAVKGWASGTSQGCPDPNSYMR